MRFTAKTRGCLKCEVLPRLTCVGGRYVRTILSDPKFLECLLDNQIFSPMVLHCVRRPRASLNCCLYRNAALDSKIRGN